MEYKIVEGDSRHMWEIPDESVELVFTSPPYYNVKQYDTQDTNIGNINNFDLYMKEMEKIFKECYRILKDGCFIVVNISDIRADENGESVRFNIPSYYSILLSKLGFTYKEDIIWEKYVIVTDKRFGVTIQQAKPRYYYPNNIYEHNFVFLKGDKPRQPLDKDDKLDIKYLMDNKFHADVWHIAPDPQMAQIHEAPFPMKLAEMIVKIYSSKGETVVDPFLGMATTMLACKGLRRNCIGYEINPEYTKLEKERVGFNQMSLAGDKYYFEKGLKLEANKLINITKCSKCQKDTPMVIDKMNVSINCSSCGYGSSTRRKLWDTYDKEEIKLEN